MGAGNNTIIGAFTQTADDLRRSAENQASHLGNASAASFHESEAAEPLLPRTPPTQIAKASGAKSTSKLPSLFRGGMSPADHQRYKALKGEADVLNSKKRTPAEIEKYGYGQVKAFKGRDYNDGSLGFPHIARVN